MPALAATDPRMLVDIDKQNLPPQHMDIQGAIKAAAPILWDRLLPRSERAKAMLPSVRIGLVSRIRPTPTGFQVEFNRDAVFKALDAAGIPYLKAPPKMQVLIQLTNSFGQRMYESEHLLQEYLRQVAPRWGVQLSPDAPVLILSWRWLPETQQVMLVVRGDTPLQEFRETRTLTLGDFMPELQDWGEEMMLAARDSYALQAQAEERIGGSGIGWQVNLSIARSLDLAAQAAWEDALRADPRVKALLPLRLSVDRQSYRLLLNTSDDSWLPQWFQSHGMELQATNEGWLAR